MLILYSTHCPKCQVLETKLNNKEIKFDIIDNVEAMKNIGIESVPYLNVNGELLNFHQAIQYINKLEK